MTDVAVDFHEFSRRIAAEFLETVIAIDDRASFDEAETTTVPGEVVTPSRGTARLTDGATAEPGRRSAHALDAKRVSLSFAGAGLVCGVLKPSQDQWESFKANATGAARRADVVIVDWQLCEADDGSRAIEIIQAIRDSDGVPGRRSRLFVVYAGTPDPESIAARLETLPLSRQGESFRLDDGNGMRCVVLVKDGIEGLREDLRSDWQVTESGLPCRVIDEFARHASGLLANVALRSLAVLRANSHALLKRFPRELDPAFVTHRILLPDTRNAEDHAAALVGGELTNILDECQVGAAVGVQQIALWLDSLQLHSGLVSLPGESITIEQFRLLVEHGLGGDDRPAVLDFIDEGRYRDWKKRLDSSWSGQAQGDADARFGIATTFQQTYSRSPQLTLGTVVSTAPGADGHHEFLVCVQPRCDSVRLTEPRCFPFLPLQQVARNFDLIIPVDSTLVHCKANKSPFSVRMIEFSPDTQTRTVLASLAEDGVHAEFLAHGSESRYRWVGQLNQQYMQKLVNDYANAAGRVGIDQSEWLRLRGRS
jgi:hypothetical protein